MPRRGGETHDPDHPALPTETEARPLHRDDGIRLSFLPASAAAAIAALAVGAAAVIAALAGGVTSASADPLRLGLSADVGVPDGGTASLSMQPLSMLRLRAGVSHNLVSPGIRAGVTLLPLDTWLRPVASLDVGHYWEGDANQMARRISGDETIDSPTLRRFHYDYANAQLGLEMGKSWGTFYLNAGISRIVSTPRDLEQELMSDGAGANDTTVTFTQDPKVTAWTPSARLGFLFYLPI